MTGIQVLLAPPRPLLAFVRLPVVVLSTSPALLMRHHPAPTILCVLLFANQSDDDERPWIYSKEKQPQTRSRVLMGAASDLSVIRIGIKLKDRSRRNRINKKKRFLQCDHEKGSWAPAEKPRDKGGAGINRNPSRRRDLGHLRKNCPIYLCDEDFQSKFRLRLLR